MGRAGFRDRALTALLVGGALAGNDPEKAGEQRRSGEACEGADLGHQPGGGEGVDAAQAAQPCDHGRVARPGYRLLERGEQARAAAEQQLDRGQIVSDARPRARILELEGAQPAQMLDGPGATRAAVALPPAQQELREKQRSIFGCRTVPGFGVERAIASNDDPGGRDALSSVTMTDLPPLVFLHGIGTGPEAWRAQVEAFHQSREVLTPAVAPSLEQASFEMEALGLACADLCGLSWGSLVALRYTLAGPERVSRLVLAAGFASLPVQLRMFQYVMSMLVRVVPGAPRELAGPMREGARIDVREQARRLETPTLVLCGERDRVNLSLSRSLARLLPTARFETVPDAGHVANVDNPLAFNALLDAFLSRTVA